MKSETFNPTEAAERLAEYWSTYNRQPAVAQYSIDTFMRDALYGVGIAISDGYQCAGGFDQFKRDLAAWLKRERGKGLEYNAWDFISELLSRTHGGELNFTVDRLEAVKGRVPIMLMQDGKITLQAGRPIAWPDIGEHINADMANGHDEIEPLLTEIAQKNMEGAP